MKIFKNRFLLLVVLFFLVILLPVGRVDAQQMEISPMEFSELDSEFVVNLYGLNPSIEYKIHITCKGMLNDYRWDFIPEELDSKYWINEQSTGVKFQFNKDDNGQSCLFKADKGNSQTHTVNLNWGRNGKVSGSYLVNPPEQGKLCSIVIDPNQFDLTYDQATVEITVDFIGEVERTGDYGLTIEKEDGTFVYSKGSLNPNKDMLIVKKLSDFIQIDNPGLYEVLLGKGRSTSSLCREGFTIDTYLPPTPTPDPTKIKKCADNLKEVANYCLMNPEDTQLCSGSSPNMEKFCIENQDCMVNYPACAPYRGQKGVDSYTPQKICEQLEGEQIKKCNDCFGNDKSYTALGCIPTDTSGFIKWILGPFMGIAGGIAFLLILKGGYQIMFSRGNPESITDGKDTIVAAVSGLIIIILSVAILEIIGVDILNLPGFGR